MAQFRSMQASTKSLVLTGKKSAVYEVFTSYNCDILINAGGVIIPLWAHDYSNTTGKQATIYSGLNTAQRRKRYNFLIKNCAHFATINKQAQEAGRNFKLSNCDADKLGEAIEEAREAIAQNNI